MYKRQDPKYAEAQAAVKKFYEEAKPFYEKARALKPDQKDLWLQGLYRVYYNSVSYTHLVREAYLTGRGRVIMRAKAEIETGQTHRWHSKFLLFFYH